MQWLTELLQRPAVSWSDALDIGLVSFLIYELLLLIRGTRAVQMALSGGFLILLFFLSRWLQLETVNWVIRNLAAYVVFAIIVLFQSDIRRALAHFGRAPFFRYFERAESAAETIEEIVVAASTLATRRIGAIVVIERQIGLRNYIEGGIPLDAMVTYDLLASIFQPGSPLHDGAVIIQSDRVAAAACFLPLSVNPRVSRDLGTRHRAALGLTEENDAIAVVVSEETGSISLVIDGNIERGIVARPAEDAPAVAARPPPGCRPRRDAELAGLMAFFGLRHFGLKFLSIALAAMIWLLVSGERIVERAMRIPLEFTNLPAQLEIVGDAQNVVDVRLRGSSGALSRVSTGELVAMLDLRSARTGRRLFHITGADVRTPFGVEVVQVMPATLSMNFEPSGSKIVPIVPAIDGDPAAGYLLGTVTADPATVEVVGPISALGTLTEAITEPISVTDASEPVVESVTVGVPDQSVRLRAPQTARVTVQVSPAPVEWAVAAIPVQVRNSGSTMAQVAPTHVTVHVRGPRETMGSGAGEFEASIDISGLRTGQYQVPVRVVPPARIGVVSVEPQELRVRIK